jgi:hypothetical protein
LAFNNKHPLHLAIAKVDKKITINTPKFSHYQSSQKNHECPLIFTMIDSHKNSKVPQILAIAKAHKKIISTPRFVDCKNSQVIKNFFVKNTHFC